MYRRRETFSTCARFLLIGLLASCAAEPADQDESAQVSESQSELSAAASHEHAAFALTTEGIIRGTRTAHMRSFKGIPYAKAPVGDLRWTPPQRAERHHGILDATKFATHCPQPAGPFGQGAGTAEDCLFLNVYAPRHHEGLKPVMVWIHGGALVTGESDDYDPTRLVEQGDVIVVTINYRLGELGFMAHPAISAGSPTHASGNFGLMDQREALRWVQRNALLFGGDPFRVTIFGESAGGLSVHTQLASPTTKGLFQRAIVESGSYQLTQTPLATAEKAGSAFAAAAGCADQTAACLRGLTVAQILAAQPAGLGGPQPVIDNDFLTQSTGAAFASGQFNRVPVMEGSNHDEWRLFVALLNDLAGAPVTAATYGANITATVGAPAAALPLFEAQYPLSAFPGSNGPDIAIATLGTDAIFACNARVAQTSMSQFVPTFAYQFSDENAPQQLLPPVSFPYAAAHASEIQYIFDSPLHTAAQIFTADQLKLANSMVQYWTTFARTGQPNSFHEPFFPQFSAQNGIDQSLVTPSPKPETTFTADHKCAFWASLAKK